jgi:hypothetical protein
MMAPPCLRLSTPSANCLESLWVRQSDASASEVVKHQHAADRHRTVWQLAIQDKRQSEIQVSCGGWLVELLKHL